MSIVHQQLKSYYLRRRRDLNPRGGFIPLPLSRRVPWTGLGDASQINGSSTQISKQYLRVENSFISRAEGVGFEPTRSVNPFRFSRPVPSATRRALLNHHFTCLVMEVSGSRFLWIVNSLRLIFVNWGIFKIT
jgi:hypothetical protein